MAITDYNSTPGLNTAISGINVAEGCAPGNINDAIRQMMADLKTYDATTLPAAYQPKDADLTAIAGLTSAADRVPYYTGAGTAALATFTAAGRALVDDADAAAQRTTLGLVIGTNVQAYDAALASLAGLSLVQGDILYATAADTLARLPKGTAGQRLRMNTAATAPEWVGNWDYDSGNQTLTLDASGTLAHSLGAIPSEYQAFLVCTTTDAGWAVNDTVVAPLGSQIGGSHLGVTLGADGTNMYFAIGSNIQIRNKSTTTTFTNITASSWRLIVRARR